MTTRFGLSANGIKWIAIFAMIINHIGWMTIETLGTWGFFPLFFVGHLTMPIMGFFIAEGFRYTRDRKKYALRLLVFALLSQLPYNYFKLGNPLSLEISPTYFNVLFTLLLGLCALWVAKSEWKLWVRIPLIILTALASILCDWPIFGILYVLAFGLNSGSSKRQVLWYSLTAAVQIAVYIPYQWSSDGPLILATFGLFLVLIPLALYNGKKSSPQAPVWTSNKWIFYIIFPTHLVILAFLHFELGWLK